MKNKKNGLTLFQSYRLYSGGGLLSSFLVFAIGEILVYLFCVSLELWLDSCFDGHSTADVLHDLSSNLSQRGNSDPTQWIFATTLSTSILLQQFDRSNPGGKFFRTVKGGFSTYRKYRFVVNMIILVSAVICATVAFLLDYFGIIGLKGGIVSSIACVTSVVYSTSVYCIAIRIKNKVFSSVTSILTVVICSCIFGSLPLKGTEVMIPFIILLAIGLVLFPISMRSYFSYYKRVFWD